MPNDQASLLQRNQASNGEDTLVKEGNNRRHDPTVCPACYRKLDPQNSRHRFLAFLTEGSTSGRFGPGGFEGFRDEIENARKRE